MMCRPGWVLWSGRLGLAIGSVGSGDHVGQGRSGRAGRLGWLGRLDVAWDHRNTLKIRYAHIVANTYIRFSAINFRVPSWLSSVYVE